MLGKNVANDGSSEWETERANEKARNGGWQQEQEKVGEEVIERGLYYLVETTTLPAFCFKRIILCSDFMWLITNTLNVQ